MKRFVVFAEKKIPGGTVLTRAGNAVENRDGSINVYLDVLPTNGKLIIREPVGTERTQEQVEVLTRDLGSAFGLPERCNGESHRGTGRRDPERCILPKGHAGDCMWRSIPEAPAHGS